CVDNDPWNVWSQREHQQPEPQAEV
ncbi:hypothetical protein KIPB_013089, partial [Kipferlia bialata]